MKAKLLRKNRRQGQIPGTLEAPKGALSSQAQVFGYDIDNIEEIENCSLEEIGAMRKKWPMVWVNVSGLADTAFIAGLGDMFALHPLAMEDVLHTPQRPKVDEYDDSIFLIARMVEREEGVPVLDQLSLFWGEGFVISFQERPGDVFNPIRERLRKGGRRLKMSHADYMAYVLLDAVIDGYFPVLEQYGDKLDGLEETIINGAMEKNIREIHKIKRDLHALRLFLWPLRDAVSKMRTGMHFIREETQVYLRDCQDHIIQILDIIENYRERISSINDLYLSSVNYRLNEVMKVLTIIATIFIPLNFIAGIYGMNFSNMPELRSPYGYPVIMAFMALLACTMLIFFWRAGWIGRKTK